MNSSGAIPVNATKLVANTIWHGLAWTVKVGGDRPQTSYWNTYDEASICYENKKRDNPGSTVYGLEQVPVLFVYVDEKVKISPLFEIGF